MDKVNEVEKKYKPTEGHRAIQNRVCGSLWAKK
jgi:hypothetical protein